MICAYHRTTPGRCCRARSAPDKIYISSLSNRPVQINMGRNSDSNVVAGNSPATGDLDRDTKATGTDAANVFPIEQVF